MRLLLRDNEDFPNNFVNGAGILLFSVINGEPHFLLARDVYKRDNGYMWSGFEGNSLSGETEQYGMKTATREFMEESMGVVVELNNAAHVYDVLYEKRCMGQINLIVDRKNAPSKHYTTYVKEIEYDDTLPSRFEHTRNKLIAAIRLSKLLDKTQLTILYNENRAFFNTHPSIKDIVKVKSDKERVISYIDVNLDYVEKDMITYWSFSKIKSCMSPGGFMPRSDAIKLFYIPTLFSAMQLVAKFVYRHPVLMGGGRNGKDLLIQIENATTKRPHNTSELDSQTFVLKNRML